MVLGNPVLVVVAARIYDRSHPHLLGADKPLQATDTEDLRVPDRGNPAAPYRGNLPDPCGDWGIRQGRHLRMAPNRLGSG